MVSFQKVVKIWFTKMASNPTFKLGDLVLKYEERATSPSQHTKFDFLWRDTFCVIGSRKGNAFELVDEEGNAFEIPINGIYMNPCN